MTLCNLLYDILSKVEKEKGNFGEKEIVEERVNYILKNSSLIYDNDGLYITSSSKLGIELWKDIELELPKYLLFILDSAYKEWELKTVTSIEDIEYELNYLEDFEFAVAIIDGVIREFNLIEDTFFSRVIWEDPIFKIEFKEKQEDKVKSIYGTKKLEEEIVELVRDKNIKDIQVINIAEGMYEHFYVKGVIYSTSENNLPLEVFWGKSEVSFSDLEEDEEIW